MHLLHSRDNCHLLAKQQLAKKGYGISDWDVVSQRFQVYTTTGAANQTILNSGVGYILSALQRGIPVMVGIDNRPGGGGNPDGITDHFVVIVGSGTDAKGQFLRFYDSATSWMPSGTSDENKLYLDRTAGIITGVSRNTYAAAQPRNYTVTQIRKSKPL